MNTGSVDNPIVFAMGTLGGSGQKGATEDVMQMFEDIENLELARSYLKDKRARRKPIQVLNIVNIFLHLREGLKVW
tara:strand:- start:246 stop:473 length:228 start_codon:yes stop_codon:yes gene_type:complete